MIIVTDDSLFLPPLPIDERPRVLDLCAAAASLSPYVAMITLTDDTLVCPPTPIDVRPRPLDFGASIANLTLSPP